MEHINNSTPESVLNNSSTNRSFFISGDGSGGAHRPLGSYESEGFFSIEFESGLLIHDVYGC